MADESTSRTLEAGRPSRPPTVRMQIEAIRWDRRAAAQQSWSSDRARDAASFSQSFLRVRVAYDNWYAFTDLPVRARATPSIAPNMQAGEDHTVTFRPRRGHFAASSSQGAGSGKSCSSLDTI